SPRDVEPPGIGKEVVTDEGIGKVLKVNYHKHTVKVQLEAGRTIDLKWSDVALPDE
ncbi:MAG: stage 0 sporulation family protein, partial [Veillonella sp.]|nr:stage 0 sporulation family protein [Veillonella sp.]